MAASSPHLKFFWVVPELSVVMLRTQDDPRMMFPFIAVSVGNHRWLSAHTGEHRLRSPIVTPADHCQKSSLIEKYSGPQAKWNPFQESPKYTNTNPIPIGVKTWWRTILSSPPPSFNDEPKWISFNKQNFTCNCLIHPSLHAGDQIFTTQIYPKAQNVLYKG